jgi:surfeit locus 1 family protein
MFRPLPILTVATLFALAVLIGLGVWQLERRAEKHALIDRIAARANTPAAPVEILFATGDEFVAYRPATAFGTFDHAKEVYVYAPRTDGGPTRQGFKVLTPLRLTSGGIILVDRGWVAESAKAASARTKGQVEGEVEIEGALRPPTPAATFTPPPALDTRTFYTRDSAAIAKALGITLQRKLILEATSRTEGGPEPMSAKLEIPDNHLGYAITWLSLAVVLFVIYLRYHYTRGRLKFSR